MGLARSRARSAHAPRLLTHTHPCVTLAWPPSLSLPDRIIPKREAKASEFAPVSERAFYPSRAPRSGPLGTFTKFPEYKEDPLEEKMKIAKAAAEAAKNVGAAPFKPTSKPHTTPTPSIAFHTVGPKPMS